MTFEFSHLLPPNHPLPISILIFPVTTLIPLLHPTSLRHSHSFKTPLPLGSRQLPFSNRCLHHTPQGHPFSAYSNSSPDTAKPCVLTGSPLAPGLPWQRPPWLPPHPSRINPPRIPSRARHYGDRSGPLGSPPTEKAGRDEGPTMLSEQMILHILCPHLQGPHLALKRSAWAADCTAQALNLGGAGGAQPAGSCSFQGQMASG